MFDSYLKKIQNHNINEITEHSHRGLILDLLQEIVKEFNLKDIKILHEPKRDKKGLGSPDFLIKKNGITLGYLENKKIEADLNHKDIDKQIEKYKGLSNNILLTNYLEWRWIKDGSEQKLLRVNLGNFKDIFNTNFKLDQSECDKLKTLIKDFLEYNLDKQKIGTAEELSSELASRCNKLYEYSLLALNQEKEEKGIKQLFELFKLKFFDELSPDIFAKSFSQMITFTALLAKLSHITPQINITNLKSFIPESFIVLQDLIKFFEGLDEFELAGEDDAYKLMHWVVNDEILAIINNIDVLALNEQLSYCGGKKYKDNDEGLFARDPYIYFYEEFLQKFDKNERKIRGAYYTPPPVVKYIISGINEILKDDFDIYEGLASEKITLLDFAVGTGTFLVEVFQQIFEELKELGTDKNSFDHKIRNHVLQNFFGFEYLISPFTISYLKLTRMIEDFGFKFTKKDCPKIYLTNTLEETKDPSNLFNLKGIENHIRETMTVKTTKKILIITGNPPYLKSDKTTEHIKKNIEIEKYYPKSEETNKQILCNAYIKFIRFAHKRIEERGLDQGIIGIITPTSYLEGITHRGMRNELLNTFNKIYILNLHGARGQDDNVFGDKKSSHIGEPVCIVFFVKNKKSINPCPTDIPLKVEQESCNLQSPPSKGAGGLNTLEERGFVYYKSLLNLTRLEKYRFLVENTIKTSGFEELNIQAFNTEFAKTKWAKNRFAYGFASEDKGKTKKQIIEPLSLFAPFSEETVKKIKIYGEFWGLKEIFSEINSGICFRKDNLLVHHDNSEVKEMVQSILNMEDKEITKKYDFNETSDFKLKELRPLFEKAKNYIQKLAYRPFDFRSCFYTSDELIKKIIPRGDHRRDFMNHILQSNNIGLGFRKHGNAECLVVNSLFDKNYLSGQSYLAPLYLYKTEDKKLLENTNEYDSEGKKPNFTKEFIEFINPCPTDIPLKGEQESCNSQSPPSKGAGGLNSLEERGFEKAGGFSPELILGYIYAILNTPNYRSQWAEFLDIDFPRIPFTNDKNEFIKLANLGSELIKLHLMDERTIYELRKKYKEFGILKRIDENNKSNKVLNPKYNEAVQKFVINENLYLENVPKSVIEMKIGAVSNVDGVLGQYLKARKDRELDSEELLHIQNIVKVLIETEKIIESLNQMQ